MIIIASLSILFIVSVVAWQIKRRPYNEWWAFPATVGVLLFFALLILVVNQAEVISKVRAFEATQETMTLARGNKEISTIELAAIQRDAIDKNGWLATQRYWAANPWTSWYVPAIVFDLKPIK